MEFNLLYYIMDLVQIHLNISSMGQNHIAKTCNFVYQPIWKPQWKTTSYILVIVAKISKMGCQQISVGQPNCNTTPNMIFSVTYYLDLHGAISLYYWNISLPSKVVNVL